MKHRILSLILALVLVLALFPASALANEADTVPTVTIGTVTLTDGMYLRANSTTLTDQQPAGAYIGLRGSVLTLHNYTVKSTNAAISVTGDVTLNLSGSSTLTAGTGTALQVNGDLTVTGTGSLQIHGKLAAVEAVGFTMESGTVLVSAGADGTGIRATGTVTYEGGELVVDAAQSFSSAAVTVASTAAVWSTLPGAVPQCTEFTGSGTVTPVNGCRYYFTDRATTVMINGIPLVEGSYLPSHGSSLQDTAPAEGGYAVLNGHTLTLSDFVLEGSVDEAEGQKNAVISASGSLVLELAGSSTVITSNYAGLSTDRDLIVRGSGSLWVHSKYNAVVARNFIMESGRLHATLDQGGNGVVVNDHATFISGDLILDAGRGFNTQDYINYDDPVVTVAPAAGSTITVQFGLRTGDLQTTAYTEQSTVPIKNGASYARFRFTSGTPAETWPTVPVTFYELFVAGVHVTSGNCTDVLGDGTVRFDPATGTLTLNNANLTHGSHIISASNMDLTIDVQGDCSLTSTTASAIYLNFGDLTIRGDKLNLDAQQYGIYVYGDAQLTDSTIAAKSQKYGIYVSNGDLRMTDSTVTIDSQKSTVYLPGSSLTLLRSALVTRNHAGVGINVNGNLVMDHSQLDNTGTGDGLNATHLVIRDSAAKSTGGEDGVWLRGNGTMQVLRSNVTFNGKQNAVQIKGGPSIIEDSTVTATGETSIAILAEQGLSIARSTVTANSPDTAAAIAVNKGYVLESDTDLTVAEIAGNRLSFVDETGSFFSKLTIVPPVTPDVPTVPDNPEEDSPIVHIPQRPIPAPTLKFAFADVSTRDWFYDEVRSAWANNLIDGVSETEFLPESTLTVAQAIKLAAALNQMLLDGDVTLENGADVWYSTYVDYAVSRGIISEHYRACTADQMDAPISRREFVTIFYGAMAAASYLQLNAVADNAIPDVKLTDRDAAQIYTFYRAGILTGSDAFGTFLPDSTIRRCEAAAILIRMYDTTARQTITLCA